MLNKNELVFLNSALKKIDDSREYISSTFARDFEHLIIEKYGCNYAHTCANGTDALVLALRCFDLKENELVIVPDYTFFSTAEAVTLAGGTPFFIDIDLRTFNISADDLRITIKKLLKENKIIKGVISVDLFGSLCDYKKIHSVCKEFGLFYISDSAQSFGIRFNNQPTTKFADVVCSSFFPSKPLGAIGDAGVCLTNSKKYYARIKSLSNHGQKDKKYIHYLFGYSSRIDELQSALLLYRYKNRFDADIEKRKNTWEICQSLLCEYGTIQLIPFSSSYYCFAIIPNSRCDEEKIVKVSSGLTDKVVLIDNYYPLHKMPVYNQKHFSQSYKKTHIVAKNMLTYLIVI